ncbi:MAG TPA: putative selenate reductase subunit YgfK [Bilophila wadsworthia]|uniref:putative selenate reductase subunit YgfK n=1 Tax=Bilophila wadsworthia TaxID=35833 RepID=UPI001D880D27|nr:putative selenate reductase subunit YgfK [Bilophila wadsworthia]HJH16711.1 putative selenate reductase subunit YgfK [Bilophila wadsworthia]
MHTDRFTPLDAATLLRWMQHDLPNKQLFGIDRELFFMPKPDDPFRMERYGKVLETPLGVAAGPHTQLAQNILSAWLCGARYIELKTVQVLDELNVAKPCIDMADEGYNCEWSQELKLDQSFEEYLKAFVLLYVLRDMLNLPVEAEPGKGPGFIFNMSAGYNLEGIKSPAVQRFLDRMENAEEDVKRIKAGLAPLYPAIEKMPIPARLSDNLTVSTMHGCPPDEVESIGRYFITERKYNTTIKLNPTLLGPERLRDILNTQLGYDVCVPDEAFGHDLKYNDGVAIIRNLAAAAETAGVAFGLKLTNTLETANEKQNLPRSEGMVYMSGRSLHPISINLAERLQQEFDGKLDIAFSAGVDTFNVADTLACGLRPITMSSDILKPGGYGRLHQYLDTLRAEMRKAGAHTIAEWEKSRSPIAGNPGFANLVSYAAAVLGKRSRYHKERFPYVSVKTERPLPRFDCAAAPCMSGCPAEQDIPRYLDAVARGDFELAWRVITATNPFPNVQGMACNHQCQSRCTRINYDKPLMIREVKRFVAEKMAEAASSVPAAQTGKRAAVIGAGPAGLSCARFLSAQGVEVHLYEEKPVLGGMAGDAIPAFRLTGDSLRRDIDAILKLGVRLHKDTPVDAALFDTLAEENDAVYIAVGAQESLPLGIPGEDAAGVLDQLSFLSAVRRCEPTGIGSHAVVIGAGNSAMDCARAARRLVGENGSVTIAYRRTRKEMPADIEEIEAALDEGVRIVELCAPEEVLADGGRVSGLRCRRMRLVPDPDGGRPRPVPTDETFTLGADTLIVSIGQRVKAGFLPDAMTLKADPHTSQTSLPNVFAGGDAVRGAATLINAVADGRHAAETILARLGLSAQAATATPSDERRPDLDGLRIRQATRVMGPALPERSPEDRLDFDPAIRTLTEEEAMDESRRCLQCDLVCNVCTTVCPNRANVALLSLPMPHPVQVAVRDGDGVRVETLSNRRLEQSYQIVNIADACNECGNCATFCPSAGAPYRDKPRIHLSRESFDNAPDGYRLASPSRLEGKRGGKAFSLAAEKDGFVFESDALIAHLDGGTLCATKVTLNGDVNEAALSGAVEAATLFRLLARKQPFAGPKHK